MSDRVCIMREGRIVQIGSPTDLYDRPANRYVAGFVGKSNFLDGTVLRASHDGAEIALASGVSIAARRFGEAARPAEGERVTVAVRPEQVLLMRRREALPADVALGCESRVLNRIFLGEHTEYVLSSDALGEFAALAPRQSERVERPFQPGEIVTAGFRAEAALVLRSD